MNNIMQLVSLMITMLADKLLFVHRALFVKAIATYKGITYYLVDPKQYCDDLVNVIEGKFFGPLNGEIGLSYITLNTIKLGAQVSLLDRRTAFLKVKLLVDGSIPQYVVKAKNMSGTETTLSQAKGPYLDCRIVTIPKGYYLSSIEAPTGTLDDEFRIQISLSTPPLVGKVEAWLPISDFTTAAGISAGDRVHDSIHGTHDGVTSNFVLVTFDPLGLNDALGLRITPVGLEDGRAINVVGYSESGSIFSRVIVSSQGSSFLPSVPGLSYLKIMLAPVGSEYTDVDFTTNDASVDPFSVEIEVGVRSTNNRLVLANACPELFTMIDAELAGTESLVANPNLVETTKIDVLSPSIEVEIAAESLQNDYEASAMNEESTVQLTSSVII